MASVYGCGGATAPCPTPTTLLDQHRAESEEAQETALTASDEAQAAEERRMAAERRVRAAKASLDSLRALEPAPASRAPAKGRR